MTLYVVRHGETVENSQNILQGHLPGMLTEEGRRQVLKAAENLADRGLEYECIVSSDLRRAMDSAQIIAERCGLKRMPTKLLRERDWGTYTGISVGEARERYYRDGEWCFPATDNPIESEEQMAERAAEALAALRGAYGDRNVVIVTHGLFARFLIASALNCQFREVTPLINGEVRVVNVTN